MLVYSGTIKIWETGIKTLIYRILDIYIFDTDAVRCKVMRFSSIWTLPNEGNKQTMHGIYKKNKKIIIYIRKNSKTFFNIWTHLLNYI